MKLLSLLTISALTATSAQAQEGRQLDAHEHGVGQLDIAFEAQQISMELHAPGADIVGFEYAAESAQDRAAVDTAVATLARPLDLFVLPDAAGCSVVQAAAGLESEEDHDELAEHAEHDAHADHEEDQDDHAAEHAEDHAEEHAEEHAGDKHAHDDHAAEHEEHDDHAAEAGHTEFHAEYLLTCANPTAVTNITFAYFEAFPNALEVEVQLISDAGATSFEVERDAPTLDLRDMF
jgi:hypothetical protein